MLTEFDISDFMACSENYRICNPKKDKCTGWTTSVPLADYGHWREELELNDQQEATFMRMSALAFQDSIFTATNGQPNALLAQLYLLSATGSLKLPDNQWHAEVRDIVVTWPILKLSC